MQILKPMAIVETRLDRETILRRIEDFGRVCYKSEDRETADSAAQFVRSIIKSGHESVLEHISVTVRFVCDRGVSHELVRHRIASYAQESTRYCNYANGRFGSEIKAIKPHDLKAGTVPYAVWEESCKQAEKAYMNLLACGVKPETARSVLPTSLKTEVIMTANLREWRHFLKLRSVGVTGKPHPDMKRLADDLLEQFVRLLPEVFEDIATIQRL